MPVPHAAHRERSMIELVSIHFIVRLTSQYYLRVWAYPVELLALPYCLLLHLVPPYAASVPDIA
eukprot:3789237-Rhodomonas_salina.3